ncbi:F-box/kelch-repeat protein At5g38670-like [Tasmannia lanceolata]|uniref:F-box/kelch-repeat protein At5g38670-like n=1 Tax=Tasmannia lanceolata TaxID=3420 RepID=UPI004062B2D7
MEEEVEETLLPNLPNEIAVECIARVPRPFHPNLSLVSRSWRSLLRSPLFYSIRSHLNCTQQFLYFSVRSRWKAGPMMTARRSSHFSVVVNGKIYVVGGCCSDDSWVEVFDPVHGSWAPLHCPMVQIQDKGELVGALGVFIGEGKGFDRFGKDFEENSALWMFGEAEKDFLLREWKPYERYYVLWELEVRKESDGRLQGSIVRSNVILTIPDMFVVHHCLPLGL